MSEQLTFLTVALAPELPFARVLAESVREQHPEARIVVVGATSAAPAGLPADVEAVGADALGLRLVADEVATLAPERMRVTALLAVLEREAGGEGKVVVLDPHTVLIDRLDPLLDPVATLTLVDRTATASRDDGLRPNASDLASLARIDPGVFVLHQGKPSAALIARWRATPRPDISTLVAEGTGERAAVVAEPGLELAWWNISGGTLGRDGAGRLTAGGHAVRLLRLPGFDPTLPTRLHHLLNRVRVSEDSIFRALLADLSDRLIAAGGGAPAPRAPRLRDGRPMPPLVSELLAEAVIAGVLHAQPANDAEWERFHAFLNEPVNDCLTRYLMALWASRDDLRAAYPDLDGPDSTGYAGWAWVYGRDVVPDELLPPRPAHIDVSQDRPAVATKEQPSTDPLWGVNVAGFFRAELGLGEAARLLISGLDAARVPALPIQGSYVPPCRQGAEFTFATPDEAPYPISILCLNGDVVPVFARDAGERFFGDRYTIALWWWEVGDLPEDWHDAFDWIDEVWVASDHIRDLIESSSPVPITKVTMPVAQPSVVPMTRAELGLPEDGFTFLYVYDYHSTEARKNPTGLIEAFTRAFAPGSGAKLVLKCINADNRFADHERVLLAAGEHPDIVFLDRYLPAQVKNALIATCDCYVSPHRSEGFGLTPAEAMLLAKPVIVTGYGGTMEFTTPNNAYLVDFTMRSVGRHAEPYPEDALWADPDVDHLAALMRHVVEHPEEAAAKALRGQEDLRTLHGPAAAGASIEGRVRAIYDELERNGARALRVGRVAPLELRAPGAELDSVLRTPAERGGGIRGRVSQLRQRLGRPFTARRDLVDRQLADQIRRLDERVLELTAELDRHRMAAHAEVLAQFRRTRADVVGVQRRLDGESRSLKHHVAEHRALPYMAADVAPRLFDDPTGGRVLGYFEGHRDPQVYRGFADTFCGPESRVRDARKVYLALLRGRSTVLDAGCGRGELLDLLAAAGIEARGVDRDAGMIDQARAKGHEVVLTDINAYFSTLQPASLGAIAALRLVEHLPHSELLRFLDLARSRLRDDGVLIVETVNPHNVSALTTFWMDPTRSHPLFPEAMLALARLAGFGSGYVFHAGGSGDAEKDRHSQPAYTLVAQPVARPEQWADLGERFPAPAVPLTPEYGRAHTVLIEAMLDDDALIGRMRERLSLPQGYGIGLDERVVEYPWLFARRSSGKVLDAGSVLNHEHVLKRFRPRMSELTIATLVSEAVSFPELGVAYVEADLRTLPFADASFDVVICASTLEHVGMDNTIYGSVETRAADPASEQRRALAELLRVCRRGGRVLLTLPFGVAEDHGWLRQLDFDDLEELLADVPVQQREIEVFRYTLAGWQRSEIATANDARYHDAHADPRPAGDLAAAARAVVCVEISR